MQKERNVFLSRLFLGIILVFSLAIRLINLENPSTYYFDEVYHAVTAKAYANNDPRGYEWWHEAPEPGTAYEWLHPPVAKLFMALGWKTLGQSAWAWRVPGVLFGVLVIWLTYWVAFLVTKHRLIGLLAAVFASLDGLLLAQSRIGMNDIYLVAFILLAIGAYGKAREHDSIRWLLLSGLATGLAVSTKWSGVFILGMVGTWEIGLLIRRGWSWWKRVPLLLAVYLLIPAAMYIASYSQFWLQGHTISQFQELHQQIWWYQTHLEATHSYQSKAWEWPLLIRPVWYWVHYDEGTIANIYNLANPILAWLGLITMLLLLVRLPSLKVKTDRLLPSQVWLIAYMWTWMPWLASPRIMFFYHYTPAIPFLAMALADQLVHIQTTYKRGSFILIGTVGLVAIVFSWLLPVWVGWPLPTAWWPWLFWLPSWK